MLAFDLVAGLQWNIPVDSAEHRCQSPRMEISDGACHAVKIMLFGAQRISVVHRRCGRAYTAVGQRHRQRTHVSAYVNTAPKVWLCGVSIARGNSRDGCTISKERKLG